jgi:amidase
LNPALNAVIFTSYEAALARAASRPAGRLAGVPYLLKNLIVEQAGVPFTEGSRFLAGNVSTITSELVLRLERAGLIVLGRTNSRPATRAAGRVRCRPWVSGWAVPDGLARGTIPNSGAAAVASGMVPMAHGNDLGGSIRYPASACGLFGLKPTRARVPLGPLYGDALSGAGVEHALTRSVRDSALLLDLTAGPQLGDPYPAPSLARPLIQEVGVDPGRLRIAWSARTATGGLGHPDCVAAVNEAAILLDSLGHELVEADLPGLTPKVSAALGTFFDAAVAWIVAYWCRHLGREPRSDELEPLTWAYWQAGQRVTAADYLQAIETTQLFTRTVAAFLTSYDAFLTPTMSAPPAPIGWITSTPEEPYRAVERGGPTIAYAGVVANVTGNPAMSVPMTWNEDGLPIGVHVLGRFGDEATLIKLASQIEAARLWADRLPPIHAAHAVGAIS